VSGRVLHSGALLALAEGSIYMASVLRWAADHDIALAIPAGSLAEAARLAGDDVYRLQLGLTLDVAHVVALDEYTAITVGQLCASAQTDDLLAAHAAWIATTQGWPVIATEADARALRAVASSIDLETLP